MPLEIETFSNIHGGNCAFKAFGHPLAAEPARALIAGLAKRGPVAVYDPSGLADILAVLHDVSGLAVTDVFVQRIEDLETRILGRTPRPVLELSTCQAAVVLVAAFDAARVIDQIRYLLPAGVEVMSLDEMRLPTQMLANPDRYLDPLNFATNFAFLRDARGRHTRLTTCNYWYGWGAEDAALWLCLFDHHGRVLAQWEQKLPCSPATVVVDSVEVRKRFRLADFEGSLFVHALRIAGHDVIKYALDTYGDEPDVLSCTHDANAWPASLYAGLPAPDVDESVVLWIQNSHPIPIPPRSVGLNLMGSDEIRWLDREIPPFGTYGLDVATLLPDAKWPQQLEVQAGKYFVRPRYEVSSRRGRSRMAHANVERLDLRPDPHMAKIASIIGKGYLLPAPILPVTRWRSVALPTPMATHQFELPVAAHVFDASGAEVASHRFGRISRGDSAMLDVTRLLEGRDLRLPSGYGHMELVYDFSEGGTADGWLHGLFRYEHLASGHVAETSFGAHMFNTPVTYKGEPQSYAANPPGLSTRLFLRIGAAPADTICHLVYPVSGTWYPQSSTELILHDCDGTGIARRAVSIARSGSLFWCYSEMFTQDERRRAGDGAYVIVRDRSCRLFGYHGLALGDTAFCIDHMFGF
ncbi:MAG: hypothetical protein ACYDDO_06790 [Acidiferrobacterales bacterium]